MSCTYLACHELESKFVIIVITIIIIIAIVMNTITIIIITIYVIIVHRDHTQKQAALFSTRLSLWFVFVHRACVPVLVLCIRFGFLRVSM